MNLRPGHHGYAYQDIVTANAFVDSIRTYRPVLRGRATNAPPAAAPNDRNRIISQNTSVAREQ